MASQDIDHFRQLANEIITIVAEDLSLTTGDLAAFAATCRRHHDITNPIVYRKNINEEREIAGIWAVLNDSVGTLVRLAENGANITAPTKAEEWGRWDKMCLCGDSSPSWAPLAMAAARGSDGVVEYLLAQGADIQAMGHGICKHPGTGKVFPTDFLPCHYGWHGHMFYAERFGIPAVTPLHVAICYGHLSTVERLLARGADPRRMWGWRTRSNALHSATRKNQGHIVEYLLRKKVVGVDETDWYRTYLATPLYIACINNYHGVARLLVDAGAKPLNST